MWFQCHFQASDCCIFGGNNEASHPCQAQQRAHIDQRHVGRRAPEFGSEKKDSWWQNDAMKRF